MIERNYTCDQCGKETTRLYGMSNGQFFCRKCADIPKIVKPEIDDNPWQVKTFTTKMPDKYFDENVNKFLNSIGDCDVKTTSCVSNDTFCLMIMYRERE